MPHVIRPASPDDIDAIATWTKDTFSWGDYIPDVLGRWLDDPESEVIVCTLENDDAPIALSRTQMLSPTEGWLSGARVHPDHRRSGLGSAMNRHGVEWARSRGARVVRLAVEEGNGPARSQVEGLGYRLAGRWIRGSADPAVGRLPSPEDRLRPAGSADADAAWMFWSQSDLARAGRDLMSGGWRWRKAMRSDLDQAIRSRSFYGGRAGWIIANSRESLLEAVWMAITPADGPLLLQGLRHLARDIGAGVMEVFSPGIPWMEEALTREGFEITPTMIYSLGL
jgi:ribosomal protein S18 acetylase RimI-like enzyme